MFNLPGFKTQQVFATVKKSLNVTFYLYIHVYEFISVDSVHKHHTHSGSKQNQ